MTDNENVVNIKLELLIPNRYQPRKVFNDTSINELAESIKEYGVLNPILVRQVNDKYEIIAGERRVRASKIASLTTIPAIIKQVDDKELAQIALIENIQRENITPIEEAKSYEQILKNANITEEELSKMIGKSQPFISNKLRLLSLPIEIQDAVINKRISEKHARTLLTVKNQEKQKELLNRIVTEKISVRELESIIKKELEKESDNMNNGNFFPNFNTTPNNTNLNAMNMQATPGQPPAVEITPMTYSPQPEEAPAPQVMSTNVEQIPEQNQPNMQPTELSINNIQPIMPEENMQQPEPVPEPIPQNIIPEVPITGQNNLNMQPQPQFGNINEIPLFANQNNSISKENSEQNQEVELNNLNLDSAVNQPNLPQEEVALFPDNNTNSTNIPIINNTTDEEDDDEDEEENENYNDPELNKYYKVKYFLEENDIPYKAYTNEKNNCIIIEL